MIKSLWPVVSLLSFISLTVKGQFLTHEEIIQKFESYKKNKINNDPKPTARELGISILDFYDVVDTFSEELIQSKKNDFPKKYLYQFTSSSINQIDRRKFDTTVKKQFGPTCTAFGISAAIENLLEGPSLVDLSERHVWSTYRKYSAARAVVSTLKNKYAEEKLWPQDIKRPENDDYKKQSHIKVTHIDFFEDNLEKVTGALNRGESVYMALRVSRSMSACHDVLRPRSKRTKGGHAVAVSGYHLDERVPGGGYLIIKNSWDDECGDKGYQYIPFNYCTRKDMYCNFWSLYGIESAFKDAEVSHRQVKEVEFDINKLEMNTYEVGTRGVIRIMGDYRHLKQIKYVRFVNKTLQTNTKSRIKKNITYDYRFYHEDIKVHHIQAKIYLHNGEILKYPFRFEFKRVR